MFKKLGVMSLLYYQEIEDFNALTGTHCYNVNIVVAVIVIMFDKKHVNSVKCTRHLNMPNLTVNKIVFMIIKQNMRK